MTYEVSWYNEEKTIIHHCIQGKLNTNNFHQAVSNSNELMMTVSHPVDVIFELKTKEFDLSGSLSAMTVANRKAPQNQRLVVIVGAPTIIQMLLETSYKLLFKSSNANNTLHFTDSFENALKIIAEYK
jgi:hypothetical protein